MILHDEVDVVHELIVSVASHIDVWVIVEPAQQLGRGI